MVKEATHTGQPSSVVFESEGLKHVFVNSLVIRSELRMKEKRNEMKRMTSLHMLANGTNVLFLEE